jgi:radical SAM protein with 4Fe4S-binding SPASM domain
MSHSGLTELARLRTAPMPRVLWIELSSKCPYDCLFCTRRSLRGNGNHMDLTMYRRILAELLAPRIIRLNYAGESLHHPGIVEAVALAAATGASTELVSVPAAVVPERLEALIDAGLDRLTVSLHTLDPAQWREIYGFSEISALRERLDRIVARREQRARSFVLDFAFVAMRRNLDQLPGIAELAARYAAPVLAIHPLIERDPLPLGKASERTGDGQLEADFAERLRVQIESVRSRHPGLVVEVSTPELCASDALGPDPRRWPGESPAGARLHDCDQSPFDSVHILSDGRVVSCEQREKIVMGDLRQRSLGDIWHSEPYVDFRAAFLAAADAHCRSCPYKTAHLPLPLPQAVTGTALPADVALSGWHEPEPGARIRWSQRLSRLRLARGRARRLRVRGLLPPGPGGRNRLVVREGDRIIGEYVHSSRSTRPFDLRCTLPAEGSGVFEFEVDAAWVPQRAGVSADTRELGFALESAAAE